MVVRAFCFPFLMVFSIIFPTVNNGGKVTQQPASGVTLHQQMHQKLAVLLKLLPVWLAAVGAVELPDAPAAINAGKHSLRPGIVG